MANIVKEDERNERQETIMIFLKKGHRIFYIVMLYLSKVKFKRRIKA